MLKSKALQSLLHCLEGSPNTSVSLGWKNLNDYSLVGELLPTPHQLGNDSVMVRRGTPCKIAAEKISVCQFLSYSISLVHSFSQFAICKYFGPKKKNLCTKWIYWVLVFNEISVFAI